MKKPCPDLEFRKVVLWGGDASWTLGTKGYCDDKVYSKLETQTSHQQTTVEEITESRYQKSTGLRIQPRHRVQCHRRTVERLPLWQDSSGLAPTIIMYKKASGTKGSRVGVVLQILRLNQSRHKVPCRMEVLPLLEALERPSTATFFPLARAKITCCTVEESGWAAWFLLSVISLSPRACGKRPAEPSTNHATISYCSDQEE